MRGIILGGGSGTRMYPATLAVKREIGTIFREASVHRGNFGLTSTEGWSWFRVRCVHLLRTEGNEASEIAGALRSLGYGVWRDDELPVRLTLEAC